MRQVGVDRARDLTPAEVRRTLFGLLDRFKNRLRLASGATVVVKVNLCLLMGPETGATIDPLVARALAEWLIENFQPRQILMAEADATHLSADMAFRILGWHEYFHDLPAVGIVNLSQGELVSLKTGGSYLREIAFSRHLAECDCLVSLAKLKTHTAQHITCIMKNQFGAMAEKYKIRHHPRLTEAICDAAAARPPDLCVVDGLIGMEGSGPTNGLPRRSRLLVVGDDYFATDHFCARLMGFDPERVPHLRLAQRQGAGTCYNVVGNPPDPLNQRFCFVPWWKRAIKSSIRMAAERLGSGNGES